MKQEIRYKRLELALLRSFCLAAEHGSFSRAAERQGLSTPAVWKQVRALERIMGTPLLKRRGKVVEQTEDGRLLLELAQPHVTGLDSLVSLFHARRPEVTSQITVASPPSTLAYYLPLPVKEFIERYPAVRLRLRSGMTSEVVAMVRDGEADLGLMGSFSDEGLGNDLSYEYLFDCYLVLLTSARHPLARKRRIAPADLVQYPIITYPSGDSDRQGLDRILSRHNLTERLHTVIETRSVDIARRYARLDVGVAVLYMTLEMASELPELHIRPIDPAREKVPMGLVTRKNVHRSAVVQIFRQLLRDRLGTPGTSARD